MGVGWGGQAMDSVPKVVKHYMWVVRLCSLIYPLRRSSNRPFDSEFALYFTRHCGFGTVTSPRTPPQDDVLSSWFDSEFARILVGTVTSQRSPSSYHVEFAHIVVSPVTSVLSPPHGPLPRAMFLVHHLICRSWRAFRRPGSRVWPSLQRLRCRRSRATWSTWPPVYSAAPQAPRMPRRRRQSMCHVIPNASSCRTRLHMRICFGTSRTKRALPYPARMLFREASRWLERKCSHICWWQSSIQFMVTWRGFVAVLHDETPVRGRARQVL